MSYWRKREEKLRNLVKRGYLPSTHPEIFKSHFPEKSYEAISRAVRRYCRDLKEEVEEKETLLLENFSRGTLKADEDIEFLLERDTKLRQIKEKHRVLKKKYRKALTQLATNNQINDLIIKEFGEILPSVTPPSRAIGKLEKPERIACLELSDIHHGDLVLKRTTLGTGNFTRKLSRGRIAFLVDEVIRLTSQDLNYTFPILEIHLLGDMFSGEIHEELVQMSEEAITLLLLDLAVTLMKAFLEFAQHFPVVRIKAVSGNHGRRSRKKRSKLDAYDNWDWVLYQMLSGLLYNQSNIEFTIPASFGLFTTVGGNFTTFLMHGDTIRSYRGISYYGVEIEANKILSLLNFQKQNGIYVMDIDGDGDFPETLNYIEMGHFHTSSILNKTSLEVIMNGSVIGNSEYNIVALRKAQPPIQTLLIADEKGYSIRIPINLSEATEDYDRYQTDDFETLGTRIRDLLK